jgi:hypothetical protein
MSPLGFFLLGALAGASLTLAAVFAVIRLLQD